MPTAWTQNYFHLVFATKDRRPLLDAPLRPRLYAFLGGIARDLRCTALAINGSGDHVHLLVRFHADVAQSALVRELKARSSKWLHTLEGRGDFAWQEGYGGFTVSRSQVERVKAYIDQQEAHHAARSFQEELDELLVRHGLERSTMGTFERRE